MKQLFKKKKKLSASSLLLAGLFLCIVFVFLFLVLFSCFFLPFLMLFPNYIYKIFISYLSSSSLPNICMRNDSLTLSSLHKLEYVVPFRLIIFLPIISLNSLSFSNCACCCISFEFSAKYGIMILLSCF